jgi:tRNA (guanosine-2'-O-)-methyltransferase
MLLSQLDRHQKERYLDYLSGFITEQRRSRIDEIVKNRTQHIAIVLEDIYQPHNASAVLRSCDCFGIMDVHIIENEHTYKVNPDVALGSAQWLNLNLYNGSGNNSRYCLEGLVESGYRIVAATPHKNDVLIHELSLDKKTALVFGNELEGLSPVTMEMADAFVKIPMSGFTESLNISVSAAICMFSLTERLRKTNMSWQLTDDVMLDTRIAWIKNNIKKAEIVEREYLAQLNET